jgi:hypothetical protein
VPPETATGGACVCTGGEAGAAGVAALCAGTSGGGVARSCVVRTVAGVLVTVLWPGSAFAARPAKVATRAPAAASVTEVVRRSRRSAWSRSDVVVLRTLPVEQRYMNVR